MALWCCVGELNYWVESMASLGRTGLLLRTFLSNACPKGTNITFCRHVVTGNPSVDRTLDKVTGGRIDGWLKTYEDFVGLSEVRAAQDKVIQVGLYYRLYYRTSTHTSLHHS